MNDKIIQRISGRESAKDIIEMFGITSDNKDFARSIIETIEKHADLKQEEKDAKQVHSYEYLRNIEMPFGQHAFQPLREVPLEYLDWLVREQEYFMKLLQAYLKHPKTRMEQNES